jgi:hypothetical protein
MNSYIEKQVLSSIQHLIDKNSCGIDGFFTDSKTAANDILKYLMAEKIIIKNEAAIEIELDNKSKAA